MTQCDICHIPTDLTWAIADHIDGIVFKIILCTNCEIDRIHHDKFVRTLFQERYVRATRAKFLKTKHFIRRNLWNKAIQKRMLVNAFKKSLLRNKHTKIQWSQNPPKVFYI